MFDSRLHARITIAIVEHERQPAVVLVARRSGVGCEEGAKRARVGYRADRDVRGMTSVLSERHHWADPGRAPRGQGTACSSDADKDHDRERDRREIVWIDAEE